MKKRLRKKLHLGEFREFGFGIQIFLKDGKEFDNVFADILSTFELTDYVAGARSLETNPIINAFFEIGRHFPIRDEIIQYIYQDNRVLFSFPYIPIDVNHMDRLIQDGKEVKISAKEAELYP